MIIEFRPVTLHQECTHFLIDDEREEMKERLEAMSLINGKIYTLYYDNDDDDYYIVNELGNHCYSVDALVRVKMLQQIS